MTAWASTAWNFAYGLILLITGVSQGSYWYIALAAFFLALCAGRFIAVSGKGSDRAAMCALSVLMLFLAVTVSGISYMTIEHGINPVRDKILAIAQAAFAFGLLISAIYNLIVSYRKRHKRTMMLRNISLASAMGSILSLERTMLGTFGASGAAFNVRMEAGTGMLVFVILIIMAIHLMKEAFRKE